MKPYGKRNPFFNKKSGYWPYFGKIFRSNPFFKGKAASTAVKRSKRWLKRLARREDDRAIKESQE